MREYVKNMSTNKFIIGPKMEKNGIFAGNKFPRDIISIFEKNHYTPVYIREGYVKKRPWEFLNDVYQLIRLPRNSIVFYIDRVHPNLSRNLVYSILRRKNIKSFSILEDIDPLRDKKMSTNDRKLGLESLNSNKEIISQNKKMTRFLVNQGVRVTTVELSALDFLVSNYKEKKHKKSADTIIVYGGNLSSEQAGFLNHLPISKSNNKIKYRVYGMGEMSKQLSSNAIYCGGFSAEESIDKLKGDWGLVWNNDGSKSNKSGQNSYYEYVCPHKLSMYAICGMPIIVGKKSAMADFVINNKCGIVINNLEEIEKKINAISQQEYLEYQKNISKIASKMALGFYTQNAIRKIEKKIL